MEIASDFELYMNMESLTLNDILHKNTINNDYENENENDYESEYESNENIEITNNIVYDMQMLSIDEKAELMYDLFDNNLDIYSVYSELKDNVISKKDPTEYNTDIRFLSNKYNISRIIGDYGIANEYCNGENFDDEDFIYNHFKLSKKLSYLVRNDNTVNDIDDNIINFSDNTISPEIVYYKILYIYQFVHYFHTTLNTFKMKKRIMHLPLEFLLWVDNIVSIIRNTINVTDMNTSLCVYQNDKFSNYDMENMENMSNIENLEHYFKDMVYGMSLCICHLKMILNHHRSRNIDFWNMEEKYIEKFFRVLNNLCVIIIYMKHGF